MDGTNATSLRDAVMPSGRFASLQRLHFAISVVVPVILTLTGPLILGRRILSGPPILVALVMYFLVGALGVTVGFHRLFAHGAFRARTWVVYLCGILGSMAAQGSVIYWVALHRRHHAFADRQGDPHSPTTIAGPTRSPWIAFLRGHILWAFRHDVPKPTRYTRDLLRDTSICFVSAHYWIWVGLGVLIPGLASWAISGTLLGFALGVYWGGLVRITLMHHVIWSVNSVCHLAGRRRYDTADQSRNNLFVALPSFGEGWHNNHHHAPSAARLGHAPWEIDVGWWLIVLLRACDAASDILLPPPRTG